MLEMVSSGWRWPIRMSGRETGKKVVFWSESGVLE
jgi:hypothetical protein